MGTISRRRSKATSETTIKTSGMIKLMHTSTHATRTLAEAVGSESPMTMRIRIPRDTAVGTPRPREDVSQLDLVSPII